MSLDDILFERVDGANGSLGVITLNRPQALNALTQTMCIQLHEQLNAWKDDDAIKAVVVEGAGDKAFCAGGDIKQIYDNGPGKAEESSRFFWHEYRMNHAIYHFPKPYIALLDGITMGGGCGVSMLGSHRVGTERLMLAMPETGIGFFPDVGGSFFLSRLPHHMGTYLGLTGQRIRAADAQFCALTTHTISSDSIASVKAALVDADYAKEPFAAVDAILQSFQVIQETSELERHYALIDAVFSKASVAAILDALEQGVDSVNCDFIDRALKSLRTKSPTSILVCFEQLKRARHMDFDAVMQMEFSLAWHLIEKPDFYEGVRAAIVDKDRKPVWQPKDFSLITDSEIQDCFVDVGISLELV